MANWCFNLVQFSGNDLQLKELKKLIDEAIKREIKNGRGQLFPFVQIKEGYLFEISLEDGSLSYVTKYVPNTPVIIALADYLNLDYVHAYCEPAMGIYGQDTYACGQLSEVFLGPEDFTKYTYEHGKGYRFEEQYYGSEDEILRILLNRKSLLFKQIKRGKS